MRNVALSELRGWIMDLGKRSAWLRKLDEECPYQVVQLICDVRALLLRKYARCGDFPRPF